MNKAQREIYRVLTNEVDWSLCAFCKYAEFQGCECGVACDHPLGDRLPACDFALDSGEDCWGFRPAYSVTFMADIVGIMLEKGWQSAMWWENKEGKLLIAGMA